MSNQIVFFDLETTGTNVVTDRIVSIALCRVRDLQSMEPSGKLNCIMNPGIPIPKEASDIHGITDEIVSGLRRFDFFSRDIADFVSGCDLAGFNLINFDVPMLWEEFYRVGFTWDLSSINIIDACVIFRRNEERTLAAAVKLYCGRDHTEAHDAQGDVVATIDVLSAQLARYETIGKMTREELHFYSQQEPRFDLAGKLTLDKDGDPCYAIGGDKGVKVKVKPSFGKWMLTKDFPTQTKLVLREYLTHHKL